jgi:hypothetical protein
MVTDQKQTLIIVFQTTIPEIMWMSYMDAVSRRFKAVKRRAETMTLESVFAE